MDKKRPSSPSAADSTVSFQPVTEGLGFHPFSDGLPYAPMGKNPKASATSKLLLSTSGAGAIAAGPPRVALRGPSSSMKASSSQGHSVKKLVDLPSSLVPRISVPVAKKDAL
ncbi:MAG: hypothetical protein ABIQ95_16870, partial [Bdellovibrionia bacterium]